MSDSADENEGRALTPGEVDDDSIPLEMPSLAVDVEDTDMSSRFEDADVDPRTAGLFWRLVLVFDVALFALVAGPALWYFDGRRPLGLQLTALGLVAFGYGVYRLRTRETSEDRADDDEGTHDDGTHDDGTHDDGGESDR